MIKSSLSALAVSALLLAGCANGGPGPKEAIGGLGGAVLGGLGGSQIGDGRGQLIATGAGAVIGALVGSEIGRSLDRADKLYMARTTQRTLETAPSGSTGSWSNPDSGNAGTVTPQRTYQTAGGAYCREFSQTVMIGGRTQEAYGTACRQPDGSWQIQ
jgi:surface antigen